MACHSNTKNMQGLFCSVLFLVMVISSAQEYSNRWTVQIEGEKNDFEASRLARKYGFVNHGKVIDNYYSFIHYTNGHKVSSIQSAHLYKGLLSEPNVKLVKQQEMKSYKLLSPQLMDFYNPNDPRFGDMWYIQRDNGPTYNVIDVWRRNITGAGVVVAVVDEGLDPEHPEIKANYDANASFDVIDNDTIPAPANSSVPQFGHGDKVAGVIGGVLNNSECGVGLAYNVRLGGIRLFFDEMATDDLECKALSFKRDYVDIYCNSWGPDDRGFEVVGPGPLAQRALQRGAEEGRRGLGSIFVFAAGNGGLIVKDSCAFNGYVNSIYTIAITGINSDGSIPIYGEHCAGIMAVTYSRDIFGDKSKVITADANKTCTDSFGASSASAAMASGLIALMLSANRELTWRDVQHIIVRTASRDPVRIGSLWSQNKAKLFVNDYVGFGLMDASRMVDAALNWTTVPPKVNCTISGPLTNSAILSKGKLEEVIDVSSGNWRIFCGERINHLEHVEVRVNLTYSRRGDLLIKLISPQGTVSNLTHYRSADSFFKTTDLDFVLMTLHFWGENAVGVWKLTLENSQPQHTNEGTLFNWTLSLHGTKDDPLGSNRHVPTPGSPHTTDKPTKARSSKVGIIVGSVCAGVVVIACAGGAAYFGYKKFYSS